MRHRTPLMSTIVTIAILLAGCGSDAPKSASTSTVPPTSAGVAASSPDTVVTTAASDSTTVDATAETTADTTAPSVITTAATAPATTVAAATPSTDAPTATTTTTPPDKLQQLPGIAALDVTVGGADPARPTFAWVAPAGAASYQLVVQTADGTPVWGWTGADLGVVLGGIDRPADVEGPTLAGPSRVRVYALDAGNALVAISAWTTLPGA